MIHMYAQDPSRQESGLYQSFVSSFMKSFQSSTTLRRVFKNILAPFRYKQIELALCEHQSSRERVPNFNLKTRLSRYDSGTRV